MLKKNAREKPRALSNIGVIVPILFNFEPHFLVDIAVLVDRAGNQRLRALGIAVAFDQRHILAVVKLLVAGLAKPFWKAHFNQATRSTGASL